MDLSFTRLNEGWNAEPNAPCPNAGADGEDVLLHFLLNAFQYPGSEEEVFATLRFTGCARYRLGSTNDEGWYRGQCRFSGKAPAWGEFYLVRGEDSILGAPQDWKRLSGPGGRHFLFYFRDHTFECSAEGCVVEPVPGNPLFMAGKRLELP